MNVFDAKWERDGKAVHARATIDPGTDEGDAAWRIEITSPDSVAAAYVASSLFDGLRRAMNTAFRKLDPTPVTEVSDSFLPK